MSEVTKKTQTKTTKRMRYAGPAYVSDTGVHYSAAMASRQEVLNICEFAVFDGDFFSVGHRQTLTLSGDSISFTFETPPEEEKLAMACLISANGNKQVSLKVTRGVTIGTPGTNTAMLNANDGSDNKPCIQAPGFAPPFNGVVLNSTTSGGEVVINTTLVDGPLLLYVVTRKDWLIFKPATIYEIECVAEANSVNAELELNLVNLEPGL